MKPDISLVGARAMPSLYHPSWIQNKGVVIHLSGDAVSVPTHSPLADENTLAQTNYGLLIVTRPIQRSDNEIKSKEYAAF